MSQYSTLYKPSIVGNAKKASSNQDGTKVPSNLESTIFSPHPLPDSIIESVPLIHSLPPDSLEVYTKAILAHIVEHRSERISTDEDFIRLQKSLKLSDMSEDFGIIYTSFYLIIREILRGKLPQSKLRSGLLELNLPALVVDQIIRSTVDLRNDRYRLYKFQEKSSCRWPTIAKFKWRIDVIISSGSLGRVMRPNILLRVRYHHRQLDRLF
jgi:hypothetical protein